MHGADEETACARALRYRQRIVVEDVEADEQFGPDRERSAAAGFRAIQSRPIFSASARGIAAGIQW